VLNKALNYSKKAYEEALLAKEASLRAEKVITEFAQSAHTNNNSETNNTDSKGYGNRKVRAWYTVSIKARLHN
jgi:hypothetical protein